MAEFIAATELDVSLPEAFDWHQRPGAFERLTPPWRPVRVLSRQGTIRDGDRLVMQMRGFGLPWRWVAEHRNYHEQESFTDVQLSGPFAAWSHTHRFSSLAPGRTRLEDEVDYRLPGGFLGRALFGPAIDKELTRMFRYRHARTQSDLRLHARYSTEKPLKVAVTGASGFLGSELTALLRSGGHEVIPLVRRAPSDDAIYWDPTRGEIELEKLEGVDAVVHLAGESIAGGRWTPSRKAAIRDSRVMGTKVIAQALAQLRQPPKVLVSASAIGFYGDRGDEVLDEGSAAGTGFLAEVCQAWEAAADPARRAGIRVVHMRTGIVLSPRGGALAQMLLPFQMGAGGVIGSGRQWMSWIALSDLVAAFYAAIFLEGLEGPVNATAPNPVTNAEFTRTLGKVLGRPTILPMPEAAVRLVFGELGDALLLEGARVLPSKLDANGFEFAYPDLEGALRAELGRL